MLAFGLGLLAVAALLRRRSWLAVALIAIAGAVHLTTALWFAVLVGVAMVALEPKLRPVAGGLCAAGIAVTAWAVTAGPLRGSLVTMDEVWLQAVAVKDSLFPSMWPLWAWLANLGLLGLLWWAHRHRTRRREATPADSALVWGATALVALFLITLPFVTARVSLPVQLQISRIFWLIDVLALVYLLSLFTGRRSAMAVAAILAAVSVARGAYVMLVERPERVLFAVGLPDTDWEAAMRWLAQRRLDTHVLADPGHAWKHGTSVRVSAGRDVFLEEVKDSAIAIYSRDVAARVVERTRAVGDFGALTADRARDLAARYGLDYLVTDADLPLPVAYRNTGFRIYALRSGVLF
jgi:hypothetical protein